MLASATAGAFLRYSPRVVRSVRRVMDICPEEILDSQMLPMCIMPAVTTPNTRHWRMSDRLADGNLATDIRTLREEGHGYDHIGRTLYRWHGIEVTRQTVATWARTLDEPAAMNPTAVKL